VTKVGPVFPDVRHPV